MTRMTCCSDMPTETRSKSAPKELSRTIPKLTKEAGTSAIKPVTSPLRNFMMTRLLLPLQKRIQCERQAAAAFPVRRDSLVQPRHTFIYRRAGILGARMVRDLLHLGDPSICLVIHTGQLPFETRQKIRLGARQLVAQRGAKPLARSRTDHRRRQRGHPFRETRIRHLETRRRADWTVEHRDIEAIII